MDSDANYHMFWCENITLVIISFNGLEREYEDGGIYVS